MRRWMFVLAATLVTAAACKGPCEKLLDRVCGCPGEPAQAACAEAKKRRAQRDKEVLDPERCRKALEAFQCASLQ